MSYILDALKKSEQERLAGGLPGLTSPQPPMPEAAAGHRQWMALAALLLILNAGALGWWLATRPGAPTAPVGPSVPTDLAPSAQSQPAASLPAAPARPAPLPAPAAVEGAAPPPAAAAQAERPLPTRAPQPEAVPARPSMPEPAPVAPTIARAAATPLLPKPVPASAAPAAPPRPSTAAPEEAPAPPPRGGIIPFADLPPAIKKALPPLNIGGYAEGAGSDTMLLVDDRLVREGEEIGGGLRVVKISPDGAVFSYRNYRFRR